MLLAAPPLGAAAGVAALLTAAGVTESRVAASVAGATVLAAAVGGLSWWAARIIGSDPRLRRWLPAAVTGLALAVVGTTVGVLVYVPGPPATPMAATEATRYWDLPTGSRIAYIHTPAQGVPRVAPVVVVHGGPGAAPGRTHPATEVLSEIGYDVYEYHQIGVGLSARLVDVGDYTVARNVADLEAIREQIGAQQVTLLGESWGATLIANYLAAHPDRVAKVVVASPGAIWSPAFSDDELLTAPARQNQDGLIAEYPRLVVASVLLSLSGPKAASALMPGDHLDGAFESLVSNIDHAPGCPAGHGGRAPSDPPAGYNFWVNAATTRDAANVADPRPALRDIAVPLLVLRGECDYVAWKVTREYRDVLPNAALLPVDGAGHLITRVRPEIYRRAVRAFLREQPLPRPPYTGVAEPW